MLLTILWMKFFKLNDYYRIGFHYDNSIKRIFWEMKYRTSDRLPYLTERNWTLFNGKDPTHKQLIVRYLFLFGSERISPLMMSYQPHW